MNSHGITNWDARNGRLEITVVSKPLDITKNFIWMYHTSNHYGQGASWSWWYEAGPEKELLSVYDKAARDLLTSLVQSHDPLRNLVHHFHIPPVTNDE